MNYIDVCEMCVVVVDVFYCIRFKKLFFATFYFYASVCCWYWYWDWDGVSDLYKLNYVKKILIYNYVFSSFYFIDDIQTAIHTHALANCFLDATTLAVVWKQHSRKFLFEKLLLFFCNFSPTCFHSVLKTQKKVKWKNKHNN